VVVVRTAVNYNSKGGVSMTKAELIGKMAAGAKISKAASGKALEAFLDGVKAALKKDDRVTLVGFGTAGKALKEAI
jgi:nucleoid DNA-binding protein